VSGAKYHVIGCPNDPTPGRLRSREEEHRLVEKTPGVFACQTCKEYVEPIRVGEEGIELPDV
jgi:hypothetical protein